jgi:radical SAM superfamily enzyme YgiQ (UPF0313 family)
MKNFFVLAGLTPFVKEKYVSFPLAPAVLAAYLRQFNDLAGHFDIEAMDFRGFQSDEDILEGLMERPPAILGWSVYIWNVHRVLEISRKLKAVHPEVTIIVGGPQVSDLTDSRNLLAEHPYIDMVGRGEGELILANYLRFRLGMEPLEGGFTLRNEAGNIVSTGCERSLPDMNVPSPYLTGVIRFDPRKRYTVNLQTYRGCPFACRFCNWGKATVRQYPLETVLEEIDFIFSHENIDGCFIFDADFFMLKKRAVVILDAIYQKAPNVNLFLEGSPATVRDDALSIIAKMPNAYISFGLQSVDPEVLRLAKRTHKLADYAATVREIRRELPQLKINIGIIYGLPRETYEGYLDSVEFVLSLGVNSLTLNHFELLPGTEFFKDAEKYQIEHSGPPKYTVISTPTFSESDFAEAGRLSSFVGVCYMFPYLRESLIDFAKLFPDEKRPHVHVFRCMLERLLPVLYPDGSPPMAICRDTEDNLKRAEYCRYISRTENVIAIYRAAIEIAGTGNWDALNGSAGSLRRRVEIIEAFVADLAGKVIAPNRILSEMEPWTLPVVNHGTKPLMPTRQAYF